MHKMDPRYWWEHSNDKNKNRLVEWKAFVNTLGIKSADLKYKFLFFSLVAFRTAKTQWGGKTFRLVCEKCLSIAENEDCKNLIKERIYRWDLWFWKIWILLLDVRRPISFQFYRKNEMESAIYTRSEIHSMVKSAKVYAVSCTTSLHSLRFFPANLDFEIFLLKRFPNLISLERPQILYIRLKHI